MRTIVPICLFALLAACGLAACSSHPADTPTAQAVDPSAKTADASTVPIISAPPARADTTALPGDHAATAQYKIVISLPNLPSGEMPLVDALRATADNAKRTFLQALPDPAQSPEFAHRQLQLVLDFRQVVDTEVFTSVRETGMQDTGGAHPIPVEGAFVYDRKTDKLVTLDDLFVQPDAARKALANFAHDKLLKKFAADTPKPGEGSPAAIREWKTNMLQMLDDGTRPSSINYSVFVVRAGTKRAAPSPGITLIFPPYQVAPYVYGTQTVEVPASVFAAFLKPAYRNAFAAQE